MITLHLRERLIEADSLLAPYAVPQSKGLGRTVNDPLDLHRFRFQRDRGRIMHAKAFRRLQGKTQVFTPSQGDHYRTRLTHTNEVAGIARDIARTLKLNEDLAECIALAHDLGHPPFGHAGEDVLDTWMKRHGSRFEHNEQSLRIVTCIESHSSLYEGLNLNLEVLEGLMKHRTAYDHPPPIDLPRSPSLEAQVVNLADEIAYTAHDFEDGVTANLFTVETLAEHVSLVKEATKKSDERGTSIRGAIIEILMQDLFDESMATLTRFEIRNLDDVYASDNTLICFSEKRRHQLQEVRRFLHEHMYSHSSIAYKNQKATEIIEHLCDRYLQEGRDLGWIRDHVASMTDAYAIETSGN